MHEGLADFMLPPGYLRAWVLTDYAFQSTVLWKHKGEQNRHWKP